MRTFNEREQAIIAKLLETDGKTTSMKEFLQQHYFTEESGRALIIQGQGEYAVFFLKTEIYANEDRRNDEIKQFFELVMLLNYLATNGDIIIYRDRKENIYYIQDGFDSPNITNNNTIVLNKNGDYTATPDTIHDSNKNIIYNGIEFRSDQFGLILNVTTGSLVVSENLHHLFSSSKQIEPKSKFPVKPKETEQQPIRSLARFRKHIPFLAICLSIVILSLFVYNKLSNMEKHFHTINSHNGVLYKQLTVLSSSVQNLKSQNPSVDSIVQEPEVYHYGIDISKWNGDEVNEIPQKDSIEFIICKATSGTHEIDSEFHSNWQVIKKHQYISGVYHFYLTEKDPLAQAQHFWKTIKEGNPDINPIVDIEQASVPKGSKTAPLEIQQQLLAFLTHLEKLCNRTPMIYTNTAFADEFLLNESFNRYPLWLSEYTNSSKPKVPKTWQKKGYKIWQKRDNYFVHSHTTDFDVFFGPKSELSK